MCGKNSYPWVDYGQPEIVAEEQKYYWLGTTNNITSVLASPVDIMNIGSVVRTEEDTINGVSKTTTSASEDATVVIPTYSEEEASE